MTCWFWAVVWVVCGLVNSVVVVRVYLYSVDCVLLFCLWCSVCCLCSFADFGLLVACFFVLRV